MKLIKEDYIVLYDVRDPLISTQAMQRAAYKFGDFQSMKMTDLYEFLMS